MNIIFESERLLFRLMEQADLYALYEMWGDADTMRYCGGATSIERIKKVIEFDREKYAQYGNTIFAIVEKSSARLAGICGGQFDKEDPLHVEAILHLSKLFWGKGYGTEALGAYVCWLRDNKKARLVFASAHPDNAASINMISKCGFIQKGYKQFEDTGFVDEPYFELEIGQQ